MTQEVISMQELLEAGVYFGHRVSNWNPKMKNYIYVKRRGVHIINLQKTLLLFEQSYSYVKNVIANGGRILFVGTKKQAQKSIAEHAQRCQQYYINHHWIGGLLTNFTVVQQSIGKIDAFRAILNDPSKRQSYLKRDLLKMEKKLKKLEESLSGVHEMKKLPNLIFVVDSRNEEIAIKEASAMNIPVIAMVDTNSSPDNVNMVIPSNDDAVRSIDIFVSRIADAVIEGQKILTLTREEATLLASHVDDQEVPEHEKLPDDLLPQSQLPPAKPNEATKHPKNDKRPYRNSNSNKQQKPTTPPREQSKDASRHQPKSPLRSPSQTEKTPPPREQSKDASRHQPKSPLRSPSPSQTEKTPPNNHHSHHSHKKLAEAKVPAPTDAPTEKPAAAPTHQPPPTPAAETPAAPPQTT